VSSVPHSPLFDNGNSAILVTAIVGLSLSLAALLLIRQQLEAHKMLDFEWVANNRIRAMSHGLDNSMVAVRTLRDYVIASSQVDQVGFRVFAESLLERYRDVEALLWVPVVPGATRDRFEASAREENAGFRISERRGHSSLVPAAGRAEYFPVRHVVPEQDDKLPVGFDLGSIPELAEALSRARDQGRTAASGRIAYSTPQGGVEYGLMVASPLFGEDVAERDAGKDRGVPAGFVVGFLRLGNLASAAISLLEPRGVEILILDESAPLEKRFLHFYASRLYPSNIGEDNYEAWLSDPDEPKVAENVHAADRELAIVCGRTALFRSAEAFQGGPWMALVAGLLFTVLLSFYLARIRENIRQRSAMERQLAEREELFRQMTETVDEAFWAMAANGRELLYLGPAYGKILGLVNDDERPSLLDAILRRSSGAGRGVAAYRPGGSGHRGDPPGPACRRGAALGADAGIRSS
jgi:CHASE1-domain containing sensor protein